MRDPWADLTPAQRMQVREAQADAKTRAMRSSRLAGHELPYEGRFFDVANGGRLTNDPGPAKCSCGWRSAEMPNTSARKRAHRQHKNEIRAREERRDA